MRKKILPSRPHSSRGHASRLLLIGFVMLNALTVRAAVKVDLSYDHAIPQLTFAAAEIEQAASATKAQGVSSMTINVAIDATGLKPQAYRIERPSAGKITITGGNATGAMYGGLDVAEALRLGTLASIKPGEHTPYIAQRGIKFNIPLDLRTPSYSDSGDSFQANIPEVWSMEFWHTFLDEMARQRYNVLSLWSLHPFPSLVKVPEFPDVALNDVWRTRVKFDDTYSMSGSDMLRPALLKDFETVKKMSIDDKIAFWRAVMQYAKDRGIDVYLFTWNIFVFGTDGKHGITINGDNQTTIDYFRASVRETVLTYPLLAGMGITAGEQMGKNMGKTNKEDWLWQTYGEGIRDALKKQPGRQFRLIHRFHMTGQNEVLNRFKDYPGPFDFSFKYSIAHMYSLTNPPFIKPLLEQLRPGMKTWLTVRNDDIYSFRWGDPDFARAYIRAMPGPDRLAGFYMGPDGYCWGREATSTEPESPRQLVMQKQWLSFMLWGRLSFEPGLSNEVFERTLAAHYPEVPAAKMLEASEAASKIIPQATRFFWGDIDLRWFPEGCTRHPAPQGFYTVKDFILGETMPGSGILNIRQWLAAKSRKDDKPVEGITPLEVAAAQKGNAGKTLRLVAELRPLQGSNKELRLALGDYEAMAHLGNYYAEKILGATDLTLFDQSGKPELQASAVRHLEAALEHWKRYAAVAMKQYKPQLLNRIGFFNLNTLAEMVDADIKIAIEWRPGTLKGKLDVKFSHDTPFKP